MEQLSAHKLTKFLCTLSVWELGDDVPLFVSGISKQPEFNYVRRGLEDQQSGSLYLSLATSVACYPLSSAWANLLCL